MEYIEAGKTILNTLIEHGHEAYFIGGMVRDYLLKMKLHDIDISTSAKPEEVMDIFKDAKPIGLKFGMVLVQYEGFDFEVTTFRLDGVYLDNRHPSDVTFSMSLLDDTARRDFTINGMAFDIQMKLYDFHHGKEDLKNQLIRAIGIPHLRFKEDGLRILRAFYFVSKLGFDIEANTLIAIEKDKDLLKMVSIERLYEEMKKICQGKYVKKAFRLMDRVGIMVPDLSTGIHYLASNNLSCDLDVLFVLSYKLNEDISEKWHLSNMDNLIYRNAYYLSMALEDGNYNSLHVYSNKVEACLLANRVNRLLGFSDQEAKIRLIDQALPIHKTCDLVFKGQDVMKMTKKPTGEWLGDLIDDIKFLVINGTLKNDYDEIKGYVMERFDKEGVTYEK